MFISAEGMCMFILYIRDATSKDELMLVKGMIALPPCSGIYILLYFTWMLVLILLASSLVTLPFFFRRHVLISLDIG
jgi:hypothetical protein